VLGGMITSTFLVIFFAPLFYVLIYELLGKHRGTGTAESVDPNPSKGESK